MRTTQGQSRVSVLEVAHGPKIEVFRIVQHGNTDDPTFFDSLRSHYELSKEPRKIERRWTVMHMDISAYWGQRTREGDRTGMAKAGKLHSVS